MNLRCSSFLKTAMWAILLVCLLCQLGFTATYYVATPANGGDDVNGDGSRAKPWATINKADTLKDPLDNTKPLLKPGDTVIVTAGTYTVSAAHQIKYSSGTADAPITYIAQGDVVVDGGAITGAVISITAVSASVKGSDYIVFDGFEIKGGKRSFESMGGNYLACREGIVLRNCKLHDNTGGYSVQMNHNINAKVYNNVIFVKANGVGVSSGRGISFGNTGYLNKVFNNTIYISGPASTATVFNGGFFVNNYSTYVNAGYWNVDYMKTDEFGNPTDIVKDEYADQFRNNIIWVQNAESYGAWDYTNQGLTPNRSLNLQHTNNIFWCSSPATDLRFIASYLASGDCPPPGSPHVDSHVFKPTESFQDPMFASAAPTTASDFALASGSPAIDAGVDVGLPYYGAAPDLGAIETNPTPVFSAGKVSDLASKPDNTVVSLASAVVTAGTGVFRDGVIYVEDEDRSCGIRVVTTSMLTPVVEGQRVQITGMMATVDGQRTIKASSIRLAAGPGGTIASDTPLKPVGTASKSVLTGPDTTNLLATIWGKVTFKAADDSYFCIDDGSGMTDGNGNIGVPVVVSDLVTVIYPLPDPAANPYVAVTGVLGKKDCGAGIVPVIRPRVLTDISQKN